MSKRMNEVYDEVGYDNLINSTYPPRDVFAVELRSGNGVLERGCVLALSTGAAGKGDYVPLGTDAAENELLSANCVLADAVDTGSEEGAAVLGTAYRTGRFNRNALLGKEGYSLTKTDEEELRKGGILLDDAI